MYLHTVVLEIVFMLRLKVTSADLENILRFLSSHRQLSYKLYQVKNNLCIAEILAAKFKKQLST